MQRSPSSEGNHFLVGQEFPCFFIESECSSVHSQVPANCPFQRLIDPVHATSSHILKVYFHIIIPSMSVSSMWSPTLRFTHQKPVNTSPSPIPSICLVHLNLLDVITQKILDGY